MIIKFYDNTIVAVCEVFNTASKFFEFKNYKQLKKIVENDLEWCVIARNEFICKSCVERMVIQQKEYTDAVIKQMGGYSWQTEIYENSKRNLFLNFITKFTANLKKYFKSTLDKLYNMYYNNNKRNEKQGD